MGSHRLTGEQRKRAIVEAALPLFAERGFEATTTRELAKAAGISEPLLYKHFPSKEALYSEIKTFTSADTDPAIKKLKELEPSTSTLVYLFYFFMRIVILQKPVSAVPWELRHRLMVQSILSDGGYARLIYKDRVAPYCSRLEACIKAGIASGEIIQTAVTPANSAAFAHHIGGWIALMQLPEQPLINYKVKGQQLCDQVVLFALRGIGMTDRALKKYYNPKTLSAFFDEHSLAQVGRDKKR
jgi:AcrR family transcriptional regulator